MESDVILGINYGNVIRFEQRKPSWCYIIMHSCHMLIKHRHVEDNLL